MASEEKKKRMEDQKNGVVNVTTTTEAAEHEEALVDLVESRSHEVEGLRYHVSYYTSKLEEAEKRFRDAESKLARFRARTNAGTSHEKVTETLNTSNGPVHASEGSSRNHIAYPSKPQQQQQQHRLVPAASSKIAQSARLPVEGKNASNGSIYRSEGSYRNLIQYKPLQRLVPAVRSKFSQSTPRLPVKSDKPQRLSTEQNNIGIKGRETKRKFEQKEHVALIPLVCKSSSPTSVKNQKSCYISTQNKKRLRSIALCPVNDQRFATSALDGVVNLWEVQSRGPGASLLSTANCLTLERRWPEDIAWHPDGNRLFSVYSADGQDSQISVTNFRVRGEGKADVKFLEDKPHVKSVINSIVFLPWENTSFVTAGTDHAVMLWSENGENKWKPKPLHVNLHSSSVMGVAGMQQKQIVLSAGKDRKIIGYDAHVGIQDFMHQVDTKCLSVLPNPCDFNLFMVQTGTPEQQLRLFDIRSKKTELHAFGWKQSSSEAQSALVDQAWSPNGMYITSGSADPVIHIFDIRYNGHKPSQSIQAHKKRVFRAMWLHSVPLLISISSDLSIGLHKLE